MRGRRAFDGDGIRELLFRHEKGLEGFNQMLKSENMQLSLFYP